MFEIRSGDLKSSTAGASFPAATAASAAESSENTQAEAA